MFWSSVCVCYDVIMFVGIYFTSTGKQSQLSFWNFYQRSAIVLESRYWTGWLRGTLGEGLDTCYSATYISQTRDQQRFTISGVAADWHEPVVPQRIVWPSIASANGQLDHGAASRHTIAPISHTRPSRSSRSYCSFPVPLRVGGWVGLSTQ